jgi:RimJ/RimL family protein N-acetyltransferase
MIETKRLSFRPWRESDEEGLFRLASDPDVGPRAGWWFLDQEDGMKKQMVKDISYNNAERYFNF